VVPGDGHDPGGSLVARHGGTTLAHSSELILLPEQRLGVAVLANSRDSRTVVATLAEEILARVLEARVAEPSRLTARISRKLHEARLADIEGSYATDFGLVVIDPQKHQLCACLMERVFDLFEYPDGWFGLSTATASSLPDAMGPLAGARFRAEQIGGREVIVATTGDQRIVLGEKVTAGAIPTAWVERVGRYELLNPDDGFPLTEPQLQIRQGRLCMSYKLPVLSDQTIQVPLQPVSDTEAIILGLGRTRGETLRAVTVNGAEQLRYSGFIGRKLRVGIGRCRPMVLAFRQSDRHVRTGEAGSSFAADSGLVASRLVGWNEARPDRRALRRRDWWPLGAHGSSDNCAPPRQDWKPCDFPGPSTLPR